jgi:hypothetical protein
VLLSSARMRNLSLWAVLAVVSGIAVTGLAACSDDEPNVAGRADGGPLPPPGNEPFDSAAPADTDAGETGDTGTAEDSATPADAGSDTATDAPVG